MGKAFRRVKESSVGRDDRADMKVMSSAKLPSQRLVDEHKCALLLRSLYGTRDAAPNWAECSTGKLLALGFSKGASSPCTFYHEGRGIRLAVHGDALASEAPAADLRWLDTELKNTTP